MAKTNINSSNINTKPLAPLSKDYFQWIDEPEQQDRKRKLNYLVNLLEQYRLTEFIQPYENAGYENMNEAVYWLLGQNEYVDNIDDYRYCVQHLLKLFATPDVMQAIKKAGGYILVDTPELLDSLLDFFIKLDSPAYRSLLFLHHMLQSPPENEAEIESLIDEYEERIRFASNGKVRNRY